MSWENTLPGGTSEHRAGRKRKEFGSDADTTDWVRYSTAEKLGHCSNCVKSINWDQNINGTTFSRDWTRISDISHSSLYFVLPLYIHTRLFFLVQNVTTLRAPDRKPCEMHDVQLHLTPSRWEVLWRNAVEKSKSLLFIGRIEFVKIEWEI